MVGVLVGIIHMAIMEVLLRVGMLQVLVLVLVPGVDLGLERSALGGIRRRRSGGRKRSFWACVRGRGICFIRRGGFGGVERTWKWFICFLFFSFIWLID